MEKMGEGTFSEVLKCQSMLDGKLYACKKMKHRYRRYNTGYFASLPFSPAYEHVFVFALSEDQVNKLREVQALKRLNPHPHVIDLKEVVL